MGPLLDWPNVRRAGAIAFVLLALTAMAQAQLPVVLAPADRFVAPGEFVTLVFRLEAALPLPVEVTAASASGWRILRQPGAVALSPERSVPVAVTVEVPADALALSRDRILLEVAAAAGRVQSAVTLTVSERVNLVLEAPREVTLTPEGFRVVIANRGNTLAEVALRLLRGSEELEVRERLLPPGGRLEEAVTVPDEGVYTLELVGERGLEARQTVRVIRFGVPPPEPFRLSAELTGGLSLAGSWQSGLRLTGPLSDVSTLDARLELPSWQRSFAELTLDRLSVRVGGGWRDPFGLDLPGDVGLAGSLRHDGWGVAAALGWLGEDRFSGVVAGAWTPPGYRVAGALGLRAGLPLAQLRAEVPGLVAALKHRAGGTALALTGEADGRPGRWQFGLGALDLGLSTARLAAQADYRQDTAAVYLDAALPLASEASLRGRIGLSAPLAAALPGQLRLGAQLGAQESFLRLAYQAELTGGWRSGNALGLRYDAVGLGLELDSSVTRSADDYLNLEARLVYYPGVAELDGRLGLRYQRTVAPFTLAFAGGWNLGEESLGASVALGWQEGPWRATLSTSLAYGYAPALTERWSLGAAFGGGYTVAVEVPPEVVAAAGGRRLGVLEGRVQAGDRPLPGVTVTVGRYRFASDADGRFSAELPPGRYLVAVDLGTVPLAYRLLTREIEVEITAKQVTAVTVEVVLTTALRGRVLEGRAEDGVPDDPARGVVARLLLTDAEGLRRTLLTDEEGAFEVRGLLPGPVELQLVELPLGASVVGDDRKVIELLPGVPAEVTFVVQPLVPRVLAFPAQALRIRSVEVEAERVPPGAAPLVRVELQGEADRVEVVTADAVHELVPVQGIWSGRVAVPLHTPPGVYGFTVRARAADAEVTRRGQLVIDPTSTALELTSSAPVRPGEDLRVTATTYFQADAVTVRQPFGEDLVLVEEAPGRWATTLRVPAGAEDAVYTLNVRAVTADGRAYEGELRFRVLVP